MTAAVADRPATTERTSPLDREPRRAIRWALVAVVLLPILVAVVRALRRDWFPIGDSALLYIRARDVLTSDHPFLGSWTSASLSVGENMNNPGALYDDLIAPSSRLLPFSSAAAVGVGLLNGAFVVGIAGAARAIGGWAMQRWMLLACAALTWIMGSELLIDIWQAHALLLPFFAYLVLMVGLACGQLRWLPWAAFVGSLLVQTHISYVYVLVVVTAAAAVVAAADRWPVPWQRWRPALRSPITLTTLAVLAVCWAQPVWEQLFGAGKGNLGRLVTNSSGGDVKLGGELGARFGANILVQPLWRLRSGFSSLIPDTATVDGPDGPFIDVTRPLPSTLASFVGLVALAGVLGLLAVTMRRRGRVEVAAACWIGSVLVVAVPLCLSLVTVGRLFAPHHVRWLWVVGVFAQIVAVWAVVELAVARWRSLATLAVVAPLVLTVGLAGAAVPFLAQQQGPVADYETMPALRRVFRQLEPLRASEPVVYDTSNVRVFEPYSATIMMRLQELGVEFRVTDEGMVRQLGDGRRADGTERTRIFQLEGAWAIAGTGDSCVIARASALDQADEARAEAIVEDLVAGIVSGSIPIDPDAVDPVRADELLAARTGDAVAARWLVLDGAIGAEALGRERDADLALVRQWVDSTIAVLADDPVSCPS